MPHINLAKVGIAVSVLALLISGGTLATTWYIYSTLTRPQTDFQRIDIELQRLRERLAEEIEVVSRLKAQGREVGPREEQVRLAGAAYAEAWNAWIVEHDYKRAEQRVRDAARLLPPPPPPPALPMVWALVAVVVAALAALAVTLLRRRFIAQSGAPS